jgi:hypothetical protein
MLIFFTVLKLVREEYLRYKLYVWLLQYQRVMIFIVFPLAAEARLKTWIQRTRYM